MGRYKARFAHVFLYRGKLEEDLLLVQAVTFFLGPMENGGGGGGIILQHQRYLRNWTPHQEEEEYFFL